MKSLWAFLFFCLGLATATTVQRQYESKVATKEFLARQRDLFQLLYHVHQPNVHSEQVEIGKKYDVEAHIDDYNDHDVVKHFMRMYKVGILPKGQIFSVVHSDLTHQAEMLFKLFYTAKDFDTFYKTACWSREFVNEQMFVYAVSVAVLHRPDTQGLILPPPYEIQPNLFFPSEVIDLAYKVKMQGHGHNLGVDVNHVDDVVHIYSNYTGWYVQYNKEQKMSYYTEDISLNSFYHYFHLDYPFWMPGDEFGLKKDGRGEIFYHTHRQLLARYYLERLSNGLGEIPDFSWYWVIPNGYYPSLKYHNGLEFSYRPNNFQLNSEKHLHHLTQVVDYEARLRTAVDIGYLEKRDGTKIWLREPKSIEYYASIVESNADNPNTDYYGNGLNIAKMLLGNSPKPLHRHAVVPSVLEHFLTCSRDPMFYQLHKRYIEYMTRFKNFLPSYTTEELDAPGIKIQQVEVGKVYTYMEKFDVDITNGIYQNKYEVKNADDVFKIKTRQMRLNHKSFPITVKVVSENPAKVVFRTFIGPKYDSAENPIPLTENRVNFVEIDKFVYELKSGKNTIERYSADFAWSINDFTPSHTQYKNVLAAIKDKTKFTLDMSESHSGFPSRLVFPKGRRSGMPFQLYVVVSLYHPPKSLYGTGFDKVVSSGIGYGATRLDDLPLGFPLDRPVNMSTFFTPNMYFKDFNIYHKTELEMANYKD